jgi:selenium metabolism protein YedF
MRTVDCRGLNCPEPVLRTKNALAEGPADGLKIVVDNETARENVLRFARSRGKEAEWHKEEDLFYITVKPGQPDRQETAMPSPESSSAGKPVLLISTNQLGQGSSELGEMLMRNFIYTLTKRDDLPRAIVFMNSGVKLTVKESPAIEELDDLQARGVQILVCGTCLDYYELKGVHKAGQVSNMYDIADLLFDAGRVITV